MTTKSRVLREVFAELRRTLGPEIPARQLLVLANGLLELYLNDDEPGPLFDDKTGYIPFDEWPVDIAMKDGGWRIAKYEEDLERSFELSELRDLVTSAGMRNLRHFTRMAGTCRTSLRESDIEQDVDEK